MSPRRFVVILTLLLCGCFSSASRADWKAELLAIPIQSEGRVMPLETYARELSARLTGSAGSPAGRDPIEFFCELWFRPGAQMHEPIIRVAPRSFRVRIGLDPERQMFAPAQIASNHEIVGLLEGFADRRLVNPAAFPLPDQKRAIELRFVIDRLGAFSAGAPLPIVPGPDGGSFLLAGAGGGDPGTERVVAAISALRDAYLAGAPLDGPAHALAASIEGAGSLSPERRRALRHELVLTDHDPGTKAAIAYALALLVFFGARRLHRWPLYALEALLAGVGIIEHAALVGIRAVVLERAPVSNSYEALLWAGLVAAVIGAVAGAIRRGGWYTSAGIAAGLCALLLAGLTPIQDQASALPPALRSNFWLTAHVLTIVASYGVLAVASALGHAHLIRSALSRRRGEPSRFGGALITQTYRMIQVGLLLLTAGTVLGGVWAADSWGRFWGWDPKETWALVSIATYFVVLHARHTGWIRDFGLAASAVLAFAAIVWTFYGVNFVMATGLHTYGFGSGGAAWVAAWVGAEAVFVLVCRPRDPGRTGQSTER
ncbi:MAG: cytochrome c biogenesis protein CcsA [Phycisphaeraceae bacterium]|nr:cytochrome c biogenesis protein CcsA [Phycisphaeraceae bacterium]MCB9848655.1 cytochrome c biogenesis protein CcsA [Phycisphaeraceae bacterium]